MKPYYEDERAGIVIYHGDCREVLPSVGAVDCVFTSPPYNCGMDYGTHDDAMPIADYFGMCEDAAHASAGILRAGGYAVFNIPNWIGSREDQVFAFSEFQDLVSRHIPFEDVIVWVKHPSTSTGWGNYPTSPRIRASHEWLMVHRAPANGPLGKSDISWAEWSRLTQSIWRVNPMLPYAAKHPATFPDELARRVLLLYSPAGATICDPFAGTGTALVAARDLGRKAIGIEIEERYCEIAAKRLSQEVFQFGTQGDRE